MYKDADYTPITPRCRYGETAIISSLLFSDKVVVVGPHSVLNREGLSQPIHGQRSDTNPPAV